MHHGRVVLPCIERKWPPRGEHFASWNGFSILADFCPARETFNILHRTVDPGKDDVIAFFTDEKSIYDDRVAKTFWNEIIFKPMCFVII